MQDTPHDMARFQWPLALFVAGLLPGFYQILHPVGLGLGPGYEMAVIARNLVEYGTYGDSFRSLPTGPTATNPPVYPLFLALCIKIFKSGTVIGAVVLLANAMANALAAALLPFVSVRFWGNPAAGAFGGALLITAARLLPPWDASFKQLGLILFCLLTMSLLERRQYSAIAGMITGVGAGVLFLLSQVALLVTVPWLAFLLAVKQARRQEAIRFVVAFAFAALLVNAPWLARNYAVWGKLVTRTNFGFTLSASNNDCTESSLLAELNSGCYAATHPDLSIAEATLLKEMGEPAYDRHETREALAWIRAHPGRFLRLTLSRIVEFWFPVPEFPYYAGYAIWGITALSIPGILMMLRNRRPADVFVAAVFLVYPLLYYIVVSSIRYMIPVLWLSALAAGHFLASVLDNNSPDVAR